MVNRKLFLILIILVVILSGAFLYLTSSMDTSQTNTSNTIETTVLGSNSNGTVYKTICGNTSSDKTVVLILGVHNLENGTHDATNQTITKLSKNNQLTKKYVVYNIKINWNNHDLDTNNYQTNRYMGELLGHDYVVNDIKKYKPFIVVDIHEMEDYWSPDRYIQIISTDRPASFVYEQALIKGTGINEYNFTEGTSPQWVTEPIAKEGFNTILFEYAQAESQSNKLVICEKLIRTIDSLNPTS